jgi:predicted cation transporter
MNLEALGLVGLLFLVLVLPFSVRHVEEELEAFLLLMGALSVTVSGQWSLALVLSALREPVGLVMAVLVAGALFLACRPGLRRWVRGAWTRWGAGASAAALVVGLGLLSAGITALVAALVLAEVLDSLRLPRRDEVRLAVLSCFGIGLGSALTPLGGPLAAIALARYQAGPWLLVRLLGPGILAGLALLMGLAWLWGRRAVAGDMELPQRESAHWGALGSRALRVYGFVVGLVLLGQGFEPLARRWLQPLPGWVLFWANSSSALLDNATLVAAEVGPQVPLAQLRWLMMGLLLGGGMLIPGNLPNIICASQRGLSAKEWAKVGVPVGLGLMVVANLALWAFVR